MAKTIKNGEYCKIVEANGWYYVDIGKVSIHCAGQGNDYAAQRIFEMIEHFAIDITESD